MKNSEKGFTLIELLVVVAIIGILAAIAIPQYATYKRSAVDSKMKSDLHNAATAMEAYYGSDANTYENADVGALKTFGYRQSDAIALAVPQKDGTSFTITAATDGGNFSFFTFDSDNGQIVGTP